MKIELTREELAEIINRTIIQTTLEVEKYLKEQEESEHEDGVFFVELDDMVNTIGSFKPTIETVF